MAYSDQPTQSRPPKSLTIGMAVYDDFNGVYFSVQALRLYHPEVLRDVDILVVDNNPHGPDGSDLAALAEQVGFRYVPFDAVQGTAAPRDRVFREADTPWVMCMDCHVMFPPGVLRKLLDYAADNPDSPDLLQGPLLDDSLGLISTHFRPSWQGWMFGEWDTDNRGCNPEGAPFDIPMQGLGVFGCRRDAWPGFNPRFRGFGGEEGYLHYKFRQAGRRTLCLPFLRWVHRFGRPAGVPYPNLIEDRLRNYLIGCAELSFDPTPIEDHFRAQLGDDAYATMRQALDVETETGLAGDAAP